MIKQSTEIEKIFSMFSGYFPDKEHKKNCVSLTEDLKNNEDSLFIVSEDKENKIQGCIGGFFSYQENVFIVVVCFIKSECIGIFRAILSRLLNEIQNKVKRQFYLYFNVQGHRLNEYLQHYLSKYVTIRKELTSYKLDVKVVFKLLKGSIYGNR